MRRFYCGMALYGITYTSFIAIEFSLYESLLQVIERKSTGQSFLADLADSFASKKTIDSGLNLLSVTSKSQNNEQPNKPKQHFTADVMLAGILAGSIAGFATNSIEYLAVNK